MPLDDGNRPEEMRRRIDGAIDRETFALLDVRVSRDFVARVEAAIEASERSWSGPVRRFALIGAVCVLALAAAAYYSIVVRPSGDRVPVLASRSAGDTAAGRPLSPAVATPTPGDAVAFVSGPAPTRTGPAPVSEEGASADAAAEPGVAVASTEPAERLEVPGVVIERLSVERIQVASLSIARLVEREPTSAARR
jgi:hypothetical protein